MRERIVSILCVAIWAAVAAAAAVAPEQQDSRTVTDAAKKQPHDSHFAFVELPAPVTSLSATPLTTSTVRLQWSTALPMPPPVSFAIERLRKTRRRTNDHETIEDDVKFYTNTTICVRERRKNAEHYLVLESEATCLSNVRGLFPRIRKPVYVAFVEVVALSLVVSAVTCICVHFVLDFVKKTLRRTARRSNGDERQYEGCLKGWMREDEEVQEPDERSRIISLDRATSV